MGTWQQRQDALYQMGLKYPRERDLSFPAISSWVRDYCESKRSHCLCGRDLRGEEVLGYPHDAGWLTNAGKMWLFIHCPECGYEMALWKMGVSRDQDFRTHTIRAFTESEHCDLAWAAPDRAGIRLITAKGRGR